MNIAKILSIFLMCSLLFSVTAHGQDYRRALPTLNNQVPKNFEYRDLSRLLGLQEKIILDAQARGVSREAAVEIAKKEVAVEIEAISLSKKNPLSEEPSRVPVLTEAEAVDRKEMIVKMVAEEKRRRAEGVADPENSNPETQVKSTIVPPQELKIEVKAETKPDSDLGVITVTNSLGIKERIGPDGIYIPDNIPAGSNGGISYLDSKESKDPLKPIEKINFNTAVADPVPVAVPATRSAIKIDTILKPVERIAAEIDNSIATPTAQVAPAETKSEPEETSFLIKQISIGSSATPSSGAGDKEVFAPLGGDGPSASSGSPDSDATPSAGRILSTGADLLDDGVSPAETQSVVDGRLTINKGADTLSSFMNGDEGVDVHIARPISNLILNKMGAPGFYISKYLSYRKLLTQPICTLSEKISLAANVLTLTGDITDHVLAWQDTNKLKDEFKENKKMIEGKGNQFDIEKELKNNEKLQPKDQEIQLMTIDYLIKTEEQSLRRLEILKKFKYPALALMLTSTIMNIDEGLAETATLGTALAATNACKTSLASLSNIAEAAVTAKTSIADAKAFANPGDLVAGKSPALEMATSAKGLDTSAGYAEEMIVGVIEKLQSKDEGAPSKGDLLKKQAIYLGIKYGVRAIVKANVVAVDKVMRSAIGRTLVYAYNIWVIYTEFDNMKKQLEYTESKLAKLKLLKDKFKAVTFHSIKNKIFDESQKISKIVLNMLMSKSFATLAPEKMIYDVKMCMSANSCNKKFSLDDNFINNYLKIMPADLRNQQFDNVRNSYAISSFLKLANQQYSINDIDQSKIKKEIKTKVIAVEKLANELNRKNILTFKTLKNNETNTFEQEFNSYSKLMVPDFNKIGLTASYSPADAKEIKTDSLVKNGNNLQDFNKKMENIVSASQTSNSNVPIELQNLPNKPVDNSQFEYSSGIHTKDSNIWEIINFRYLQNYHNLKVNLAE